MQVAQINKQSILLLGIAILVIGWLLANSTNPSMPDVNHISITEAAALIDSNDTLILDVREKEAFDKRHLPNAMLVPIGDINKRLDEIHAVNAKEIIVYCNDGSTRGPRATKQLNDAGLKNARNLKGGVEGWEKANLELIAK